MSGAVWDRAAAFLFSAALGTVLLTFSDYGVTWDEPGLRTYGQLLVEWYRSGFVDGRAWAFANLRYYGGAFDMTATLLEPLAPLGPYALRHLLGGLLGLLGLLLAWRLARRLGGPRAGFLALLLLATLPGWWGHMFFNSKDIPFAVAVLGCVAVLVRLVEEWPDPRRSTALVFGVALGLTLGVRVGGVLVVAYAAPSIALLALAAARARGPSTALREALVGLARLWPALPALLIVLVPAWPWVALAPGNLLEALAYLGHFPYLADTIFLGRRYPAPDLPAIYWPTLLALQLTEVALAGLAAAIVFPPRPAARAARLVVATAALLPLAYAVLARPTGYNNLRHFIFVLPPLMVLAGLGLDRLLGRLHGRARAGAVAVLALAFLQPAARMVQLHPYEYVYFNDASGGVPAAAGKFELDYWGTSFAELGRLTEGALTPQGGKVPPQAIRICGPLEAARDVFPPPLLPVTHDAPAQLAAAIAIFFCADPPPGSELARVERLGIVLSSAYRTTPEAVITDFRYP